MKTNMGKIILELKCTNILNNLSYEKHKTHFIKKYIRAELIFKKHLW